MEEQEEQIEKTEKDSFEKNDLSPKYSKKIIIQKMITSLLIFVIGFTIGVYAGQYSSDKNTVEDPAPSESVCSV